MSMVTDSLARMDESLVFTMAVLLCTVTLVELPLVLDDTCPCTTCPMLNAQLAMGIIAAMSAAGRGRSAQRRGDEVS